MKKVNLDAIKYFKKSGFKVSKEVVTMSSNTLVDFGDGSYFHISQLKRLVESHELVNEHGSLERAKMYANSPYTAPEVKERLKQAIADVESCQ